MGQRYTTSHHKDTFLKSQRHEVYDASKGSTLVIDGVTVCEYKHQFDDYQINRYSDERTLNIYNNHIHSNSANLHPFFTSKSLNLVYKKINANSTKLFEISAPNDMASTYSFYELFSNRRPKLTIGIDFCSKGLSRFINCKNINVDKLYTTADGNHLICLTSMSHGWICDLIEALDCYRNEKILQHSRCVEILNVYFYKFICVVK